LKFLKTQQGMEALAGVKNGNERDVPEAATDKSTKTIIVPVLFLAVVRFFIFHFVLSVFSSFLQNR
jgi:hypothetical protein